jgi:hypothetical protein
MPSKDKNHSLISFADQELVLESLERDQLAGLKKPLIPRRRLKGLEKFVLWSLRIYLIFMMAVVVYQVWIGTH